MLGGALAVVTVLAGVVLTPLTADHLDQSSRPWMDGETHGRWSVVFTGYGSAAGDDSTVVLKPKSALSSDLTHGGLVVTANEHYDADFEITVRTEKQVRADDPNPWEVGWILWNYSDNDHFYAVALKPNGWEISKQDPAYPGSQRFLSSGTERTFPIGADYRVRVEHDWPRMTISVDGELLAAVIDDERPYRGGAVGLYTEDAQVRFSNLSIDATS